jgi:threonine synthase
VGFYTHLECVRCGNEVGGFEYACPRCGSGLEARYDLEAIKGLLDRSSLSSKRVRGMWRYAELLPPRPENIVSLGEGSTPLIRSERIGSSLGLSNLMLKLDYLNPTGSFKDRGASVMISMAKELGFDKAILDSSGNAASSISAYSARLGIDCFIFVPDYASEGKLVQSLAYGAKAFKIKGTRNDVYKAANYVEGEVRLVLLRIPDESLRHRGSEDHSPRDLRAARLGRPGLDSPPGGDRERALGHI